MSDKVVEIDAYKREKKMSWSELKEFVMTTDPEDVKGYTLFVDTNEQFVFHYFDMTWEALARAQTYIDVLRMNLYEFEQHMADSEENGELGE